MGSNAGSGGGSGIRGVYNSRFCQVSMRSALSLLPRPSALGNNEGPGKAEDQQCFRQNGREAHAGTNLQLADLHNCTASIDSSSADRVRQRVCGGYNG